MDASTKAELMAMAGLNSEAEFDALVAKFASDTINKDSAKSAFKKHYLQMTLLIEQQQLFPDLVRVEDQVKHVYEILSKDQVYSNLALLAPHNSESKSESEQLRMEGNKLYKNKLLEKALKMYTDALMCSDFSVDPKSAALAVANRSAVFMEMGKFQECSDDIQASLLYNYPSESVHKLLLRRLKCLKQLVTDDNKESTKEDVEDCRKLLRATLDTNKLLNSAQKQKILKEAEAEVMGAMTLINKNIDKKSSKRKDKLSLSNNHNQFKSLSSALSIVFDEKVGRHVKSTRRIAAGEILNREQPIAALLTARNDTNCHHCLKFLTKNALPSPFLGSKTKFCCFNCLKIAVDTYHCYEKDVDVQKLFYGDSNDEEETQISGCIALAFRVVAQKPLRFFKEKKKEMFEEYDNKFGTNQDLGVYQGDQLYRGLYNLVTHYSSMSSSDRLNMSLRSVALLHCLKHANYFGGSTNMQELSEDELFIGRLLYHFQRGIQYNLHSVYQVEERLAPNKKIALHDIGCGVYATTLFFNHSCAPNTLRINIGSEVVFVAKNDIEADAEITECYGIHHMTYEKATRQEKLAKGYNFDCQCRACAENWPLLQNLSSFMQPQVAMKLGMAMNKFKTRFEEQNFEEAFDICCQLLNNLPNFGLKKPHRQLEAIAMALSTAAWAVANQSNPNLTII